MLSKPGSISGDGNVILPEFPGLPLCAQPSLGSPGGSAAGFQAHGLEVDLNLPDVRSEPLGVVARPAPVPPGLVATNCPVRPGEAGRLADPAIGLIEAPLGQSPRLGRDRQAKGLPPQRLRPEAANALPDCALASFTICAQLRWGRGRGGAAVYGSRKSYGRNRLLKNPRGCPETAKES